MVFMHSLTGERIVNVYECVQLCVKVGMNHMGKYKKLKHEH